MKMAHCRCADLLRLVKFRAHSRGSNQLEDQAYRADLTGEARLQAGAEPHR